MEFRKLIKFGKSSHVVSLPNEWIKKKKLHKGDTVYIDENFDGLQLTVKEVKKENSEQIRAIMINTKDKKLDQIQTEIVSAYLAGYKIIEIRGENITKESTKIKSILKELAGIELVEETNNKIVVRDLMNIEEISIKVLIRRIDLIIRGMLDDLIKSIYESQYESLFQRDIEINRLVYLTKRVIRFASDNEKVRKKFDKKVIELIRDWKIIGYLESIGDSIKRICRDLDKVNLTPKTEKGLEKLLFFIKEKYLDAIKSYHTKDLNLALKIELESKKRLDTIEYFEKKNPNLYEIIHNLKMTSSSIKHIARAILNTSI